MNQSMQFDDFKKLLEEYEGFKFWGDPWQSIYRSADLLKNIKELERLAEIGRAAEMAFEKGFELDDGSVFSGKAETPILGTDELVGWYLEKKEADDLG